MDKKEIYGLLLNQEIHNVSLSLKWLADDMRTLNEETYKTAVCFEDFFKIYKQIENSKVSVKT